MNLLPLFKTQKQLDHSILENHNLQDRDLLNEKFLALQVELCELANETRCFKFWSNKPANEKSNILEEYVDVLHFVLSIGNLLGHTDIQIVKMDKATNLTRQFLLMSDNMFFLRNYAMNGAVTRDRYGIMISDFFELGEMLGFREADIIIAYYDKNEINHERQANGY